MATHNNNDGRLALSVVIPVYNEEESLPELRRELLPVLESLDEPFEVVFVDDGSTDASYAILRQFHEEDPRVRVVRFVRNFGQQMANSAGLQFARGHAVILMDADLQTPADNIPRLLAKLREGYDIVYGIRDRIDRPLYRRVGSWVANRLVRRMTGFAMPDGASGFLALDERLVRDVNRYNDRSRYLSGLFAWLSYGRFAMIPVTRRMRKYGESKYSLLPLVRLVLNFICNFSTRPLFLAFPAGLFVLLLSAGLLAVWVAEFLNGGWGDSRITLYASLALLACALQLFGIGVLGEYLGRTYTEVRRRPPYVISEVLDTTAPAHGADRADASEPEESSVAHDA